MEKKNEKWIETIKGKTKMLKDAFEEKGMAGLSQMIADKLDSWKKETINIAVLGQSGAGKSSFINALRDLTADDRGAAKVGCVDETLEPRFYVHPKNDKVRIWDFPGVESKDIPKEKYLKLIDFSIFDFFILITSKRFFDIDIWLAKEVEKSGKFFYFVRSMFGNDIENEGRKQKNQDITRDKLVSQLKDIALRDCEENLKDFKCEGKIFILDSYEKSSYDFKKLEAQLIQNASEISDEKHFAITSCMSVMTKASLEKKKSMLKERISKVAVRAAFALRIKDTDLMILKEEVEFYKQQFNLDAESLQRDAEVSGLQDLLTDIKLELQDVEARSRELDEYNEIERLIPFIPVFNIAKTYKASKIWLTKTLDMIAQTAVEVNLFMVDSFVQSRKQEQHK